MTQNIKNNISEKKECYFGKKLYGCLWLASLVTAIAVWLTIVLVPFRSYTGGAWERWLTRVHDTQLTWYCVAACVLTIAFFYMEFKRNKV